MPHARTIPKTLARAVLAVALLAAGGAHADEYADVNQLLRSGRHAEALTKADQYLAGKPKDPQMRFLRGVVLTEAGRTNEAIATFQKLTEDYPELPEPYNNLAVLYAGQAQFDKARAALEMAIRTNPSYATAHENLGDVYAKLASQAYSRALQLDASNTAVQPKLALIRQLFAVADRKVSMAVPKGTTVAAVAPAAAPAAAPAGTNGDVEAAVRAWASAWASKDVNTYLASYGKEFDPPGKQTRAAWESERRAGIVGKNNISVQISDLAVSVNGNKAVARFHEAYSADALKVSSRKTLELVKSGDRWTIVRESTGA
jgi:tetratricopeptide (TPR) repeat protein